MNRMQMSVFALCAILLAAALSVMPVAAREQMPQQIRDANELAQYQMHLMDQQIVAEKAETVIGSITNRNELAQYQAELAGRVGVPPEHQWNQWYVQYNQICDCTQLADYMNHLVDINVMPNAS